MSQPGSTVELEASSPRSVDNTFAVAEIAKTAIKIAIADFIFAIDNWFDVFQMICQDSSKGTGKTYA